MEQAFADLGLSKGLCKILADMGFHTPTLIQELALPPILSGQDVIGVAPTGTGKTLAYILPVLQAIRLRKASFAKGPVALVVTPTRELARQVADVAKAFTAHDEAWTVACLTGGAGMQSQIKELEAQPFMVVGTPGRIQELYSQRVLLLTQISFLILDEADRLMDMGFTPQLYKMLEVLPRKKQMMLFSATFGPRVEEATANFMEWPVKVEASKQATLPSTIEEHLIAVPNKATKQAALKDLLAKGSGFLFARSRQEANDVAAGLKAAGTLAEVLHSNKGQNTRFATLDLFKTGQLSWLVTTDVAARGLDVEAVPMVVQIGLPVDMKDYVHRTGRTGRAGISGICYTFIDPADEARLPMLQKILGRKVLLEPPLPEWVVADTPREELIEYARSVDEAKQAADPTFKGAFHEKKRVIEKKAEKTKTKPAAKKYAPINAKKSNTSFSSSKRGQASSGRRGGK